jgi:hypothetical protein
LIRKSSKKSVDFGKGERAMVINVDNVDGGERSSSALTGQKSAATADLEQAQRLSRDTGHFKKSSEDQFINSK